MIWRLMATVLLMSDTGSPSLVLSHTDWPTERQCREIIASHYQPPPPREFNGHNVTVKISASCVAVIGSEQEQAVLPPPIARIVPRVFSGGPRFGPDGLPCGSLTCGNDD
jgi:hypothetical protein